MRKDRGVFRYNDDEWAQVHRRKEMDGHRQVPFATWLRKLSLAELGDVVPGASDQYLRMLQGTRARAVAEAKEWRALNETLGLSATASPADAHAALRAILSD